MTYAVISDLHCHSWSLFSKTEPDGVNSRLRIILNEVERAAKALLYAGGNTLVIAGDVFHVRGSVDPEVLNPVQATIKSVLDRAIHIVAIPGNHDLKGKETSELGSAIETLAQTYSSAASMIVCNAPIIRSYTGGRFAFVPWFSDTTALLAEIENLKDGVDVSEVDLFIHAGIDGVLPGMPDHGLSAKKLAGFGFKRVFAGHYHNHKDLGDGVYSIGATTHQTWGDIGTKAGFLLVNDSGVAFNDSHAPKFIDVSGMDEDDMKLAVDGNYVRYRGSQMSSADMTELKKFFTDFGALGTSIQAPKAVTSQRSSAPKSSAMTLDQSVLAYVDQPNVVPAGVDAALVKQQCADVMAKARAVYEES